MSRLWKVLFYCFLLVPILLVFLFSSFHGSCLVSVFSSVIFASLSHTFLLFSPRVSFFPRSVILWRPRFRVRALFRAFLISWEIKNKKQSSVRARRFVYNDCRRGGKVSLPTFRQPPPLLAELLKFDGNGHCKSFLRKISQYNCLFAFTSMGANIHRTINRRGGLYIFSISG